MIDFYDWPLHASEIELPDISLIIYAFLAKCRHTGRESGWVFSTSQVDGKKQHATNPLEKGCLADAESTTVRPCRSKTGQPLAVSGLALHRGTRTAVLLANHTAQTLPIALIGLPGPLAAARCNETTG